MDKKKITIEEIEKLQRELEHHERFGKLMGMEIKYMVHPLVKDGEGVMLVSEKTMETIKKHFNPKTKEKYERQQLLKEAEKRYPVGSKFLPSHLYDNNARVSYTIEKGEIFIWEAEDYDSIVTSRFGIPSYTKCVYYEGTWAPRYLFSTEDGVDIYEDDEYYGTAVNCINESFITKYVGITGPNGEKQFSTRKAAEKYVASKK